MEKGTMVRDLEQVLAEALHGRIYAHEMGDAENRYLVVDGTIPVTELAEAVLAAGYVKGGDGRGDAA